MRARPALTLLLLSLSAGPLLAADGLAPPDGQAMWPQWQARLTVQSNPPLVVSLFDRSNESGRRSLATTSLYGDFYFDAPGLRLPSTLGGLRATSGLVGGNNRSNLQPLGETLPYLGLGYTGLASKGGFSFTADLGLTVDAAPGKAVFGNQGFDSTLRELRLSPVLQVGVRYAF